MDNNISFAKIVATPTLNSWSQAYNAGKLFAVISLEKIGDLPEEIESLNMLGKDFLERLEQEFFAIEDKNLETIKKAISTIFEKTMEGINISFAAGAFVENILYIFSLGNGKTFIKRVGSLGSISQSTSDLKEVTSSSGFLKDDDLIILTTDAFSEVITNEDLDSNLNNTLPSDIAESLAPKVHKSENGKISAIIIKYGKPKADLPPVQDGEGLQAEIKPAAQIHSFNKYLTLLKSKLRKPDLKIQPTKKIFLVAAVIIVAILIFSVFLNIQAQNNAKIKALFTQIYPQAQKKYEEGQSLVDLNRNLARDSFLSAQKILKDNQDKFPAKSKESVQTQDLLKKIGEGLIGVSPVDVSGLDRSKLSITVQNGSGIEGAAGKAANILKELGYNVASTGNADNYDYKGATIKVKKSKEDFLNLLKKDLEKDYTIKSTASDLPNDSPFDALIIIGK